MPPLYANAIGVEHISRFTAALAAAAHAVPLDTPVSTCGDWRMADLVWHLSEVQDFWIHVIENRPSGNPATYDRPQRPADDQLIERLQSRVAGLVRLLEQAEPDDAAWTWSDEQTVGFTLRRQTHEAHIHCVDALLVAGLDLPDVSPELAADGIDELVTIMLPRQESAPSTGSITLCTTDTKDRWTIQIGSGDATVSGDASDINLWLWGRANTASLSITGAVDQVKKLRDKISANS